jgi:hypothetical protein
VTLRIPIRTLISGTCRKNYHAPEFVRSLTHLGDEPSTRLALLSQYMRLPVQNRSLTVMSKTNTSTSQDTWGNNSEIISDYLIIEMTAQVVSSFGIHKAKGVSYRSSQDQMRYGLTRYIFMYGRSHLFSQDSLTSSKTSLHLC